jgi:hypothetical protein
MAKKNKETMRLLKVPTAAIGQALHSTPYILSYAMLSAAATAILLGHPRVGGDHSSWKQPRGANGDDAAASGVEGQDGNGKGERLSPRGDVMATAGARPRRCDGGREQTEPCSLQARKSAVDGAGAAAAEQRCDIDKGLLHASVPRARARRRRRGRRHRSGRGRHGALGLGRLPRGCCQAPSPALESERSHAAPL